MKKPVELVSFFLLPFALAVGLILLKEKIFVPDKANIYSSGTVYASNKSPVSFGVIHDESFYHTKETIYDSLIIGLFILSFVLPFFAVIRSEPVERNEIKLKDI